MTREEAIDLLDNLIGMVEDNHKSDYDTALQMAIKALEQEPNTGHWIPVSERLPEDRYAVLVWCPERKNIYCAYREENQWWIFGAYFEKVRLDVKAWMPLPKPFEPQESEERDAD